MQSLPRLCLTCKLQSCEAWNNAKELRKRSSGPGDDVPAHEMAAFETAKTKIPESRNPDNQPPTFKMATREATAPELVGRCILSPIHEVATEDRNKSFVAELAESDVPKPIPLSTDDDINMKS